MSEIELADWLRPIRAAEISLIVDACQSAASVEGEGFKPGPLGSRGFGQLAYDKGMLVLAASQRSNVALESATLRHGLLTYALLDGVHEKRADADGEAGTTLREWLTYAQRRVPVLATAIARGEPLEGGRAMECDDRGCDIPRSSRLRSRVAQIPRLFAFKGAGATQITQ